MCLDLLAIGFPLFILMVSLAWSGWQLQRAFRTGIVTFYVMLQPVRRDRRDTPGEFWFAVGLYIVSCVFLSVFMIQWLSGFWPF
jgi:hypothetical protein